MFTIKGKISEELKEKLRKLKENRDKRIEKILKDFRDKKMCL
jgi:gas vesicle protein